MPFCDLCGEEVKKIVKAEIEGSGLKVCLSCGKFGRILGEVKIPQENQTVLKRKKQPLIEREETEEKIVSDFAVRIKKAREKREIKQDDFAKLLKERVSLIQKWEKGSLKPDIKTAKKLEKILGIKLTDRLIEPERKQENWLRSEEEFLGKEGKRSSEETTLGDIIKIKKRR